MEDKTPLSQCCVNSLEEFGERNDMVACTKCKRIIKVFNTQNEFDKFALICKAKKRQICVGKLHNRFVISYLAL